MRPTLRLDEATRARLEGATDRAVRVFSVLVSQAGEDNLWFLHRALEKHEGANVVRGSWGLPRESACPISALMLGRPVLSEMDLRRARTLSCQALRRFGYQPRDFYAVWDAGLIPARRLLRIVDGEITRRLMRGQRPALTLVEPIDQSSGEGEG